MASWVCLLLLAVAGAFAGDGYLDQSQATVVTTYKVCLCSLLARSLESDRKPKKFLFWSAISLASKPAFPPAGALFLPENPP